MCVYVCARVCVQYQVRFRAQNLRVANPVRFIYIAKSADNVRQCHRAKRSLVSFYFLRVLMINGDNPNNDVS